MLKRPAVLLMLATPLAGSGNAPLSMFAPKENCE